MDVKEAVGSYDKDSDKLRCAIENDLFLLSQDLRKQYISILESFEPVFMTGNWITLTNWLRQF